MSSKAEGEKNQMEKKVSQRKLRTIETSLKCGHSTQQHNQRTAQIAHWISNPGTAGKVCPNELHVGEFTCSKPSVQVLSGQGNREDTSPSFKKKGVTQQADKPKAHQGPETGCCIDPKLEQHLANISREVAV